MPWPDLQPNRYILIDAINYNNPIVIPFIMLSSNSINKYNIIMPIFESMLLWQYTWWKYKHWYSLSK